MELSMKIFFLILVWLAPLLVQAGGKPSRDQLTEFYDQFFCREKKKLSSADLTDPCPLSQKQHKHHKHHHHGDDEEEPPSPPSPPVPPPTPPAPPFITDYLPIILVNNSGYTDDNVYVVVTATQIGTGSSQWGAIASDGKLSYQVANPGDNSSTFTKTLSELPLGSSGRMLYTQDVNSGVIYFSLLSSLSMTVNAPHAIAQPPFLDPHFTTNYDIFEVTYLAAGSPQINIDATAVSFFSIPLYGFLQGATSSASTCGLFHPRSYVMSSVASAFSAATESSQWNKLFLTHSGSILRLVSPGDAATNSNANSAFQFDPNYLDASSGYSYISDIWSGVSSYYKNGANSLYIQADGGTGQTYLGAIAGNVFTFTSTTSADTVVFAAPQTSVPPLYLTATSYQILNAVNAFPFVTSATHAADGTLVSQYFMAAVVAGIIPLSNTSGTPINTSFFTSQSSYYNVNTNLSAQGQSSGPWYDLYSRALHALNPIYTWPYDDALFNTVLISGPFVNNSTYISITISNAQ
jgi:hypothetical protein